MDTDEIKANDSDSDCDPEDEDMVARVKERLPGSAEVLHFLRRALSIFMLLWLKIYFKQAFSISDKKIDAYSNDAAAVESKSKVPDSSLFALNYENDSACLSKVRSNIRAPRSARVLGRSLSKRGLRRDTADGRENVLQTEKADV